MQEETLTEKTFLKRYVTLKNFMRVVMAILSFYNIVFIPLQFGFRIKMQGIYLVMEMFTILFYLLDAGLRLVTIGRLKKVREMSDTELSKEDLKLKQDSESLQKRMRV